MNSGQRIGPAIFVMGFLPVSGLIVLAVVRDLKVPWQEAYTFYGWVLFYWLVGIPIWSRLRLGNIRRGWVKVNKSEPSAEVENHSMACWFWPVSLLTILGQYSAAGLGYLCGLIWGLLTHLFSAITVGDVEKQLSNVIQQKEEINQGIPYFAGMRLETKPHTEERERLPIPTNDEGREELENLPLVRGA